jgi:hypothetical protein
MADTDLTAQFEEAPDNAKPLVDNAIAPPAMSRRRRVWTNWTLALLTVPGAAVVVLLWFGAVMGLAGCSDVPCRHEGPGEFAFTVLVYGAPVIAALTVAISFFTATRSRGVLVPVVGWGLLVANVVVLAISFRR